MKKFVLAFMLLLLLAGCDAAKLTGAKQEESSLSDTSSVPASISQPESSQAGAGASSNIPAESSDPASSEPYAPATSEAPVQASSESSASSSSETVEGPGGGEEGYDASEAVQVESVDGGIKVTFKQMPQTARDLQALLEVYPQSDARNAGAFFIASLVRYLDSTDDGHEMIDLLRGPRPMNDMDKDFLKDRLREEYNLELEMAGADWALAMTGPGDTDETLGALARALRAIDETLPAVPPPAPLPPLPVPEAVLPPWQAMERPAAPMPLEQAAGRISAGYLWAYPPGIPLILPGERVDEAFLQGCRALTARGVVLHSGEENGALRILAE